MLEGLGVICRPSGEALRGLPTGRLNFSSRLSLISCLVGGRCQSGFHVRVNVAHLVSLSGGALSRRMCV